MYYSGVLALECLTKSIYLLFTDASEEASQ